MNDTNQEVNALFIFRGFHQISILTPARIKQLKGERA